MCYLREVYQIVQDEQALLEFIDFLTNLEESECFYVMLFARSKYYKELGTQSVKLKRFTSSKEHLFDKIKQLECVVGSYKYKGNVIPNEALCLYIMPNPRSYVKATKSVTKRFIDLLFSNYSGYNPHQEVLSEIQKNSSRMRYFDFDFDYKTIDEMRSIIEEIINPDCLTYIETKNGFHLLVEIDKISEDYKKSYYNKLSKLNGVDIKGDELMPCPGNIQGDFIPRLIRF